MLRSRESVRTPRIKKSMDTKVNMTKYVGKTVVVTSSRGIAEAVGSKYYPRAVRRLVSPS